MAQFLVLSQEGRHRLMQTHQCPHPPPNNGFHDRLSCCKPVGFHRPLYVDVMGWLVGWLIDCGFGQFTVTAESVQGFLSVACLGGGVDWSQDNRKIAHDKWVLRALGQTRR